MPERDELDRLIDSELARYAEPRTGLEQRILARVEAEPSPRFWISGARQRWVLAGAIAVATVLSIGIPLSLHHKTSINTADVAKTDREPIHPTITAAPTHPEAPLSKQFANRALRTTGSSRIIEIARRATRPKLAVFPAPQPLSMQEQTFVELATHLPQAERERLLADQKSQDAPLEISSIKISPITVPALGKN